MVTVSTAAVVVVLVLVVAVMVVVFMVAASATVVAATSATLVRHMIQHVLNLFVRGITVLKYLACESQRLASQRVVGVECHFVFIDTDHAGHKVTFFAVHQCDDSIWIDVLVVKMTIDSEHLALHLMNSALVIFAEGLGRGKGEVEVLTCL